MKKTLAFFLLIFNTLSAWAATTFKSGDLYYKIVSDSEPYAVEVTYQTLVPNNNYSGLTEVEIPTTVKYNKTTYEVIGISWYAFHECADLRSVLIPNSIQTIHFQAFEGCSSLNSIIIPNSVTRIYGDAFTGSGIYNDPSNWHNHALYIGDWLICTNPDSISGIYNIKPGTRCIADEAFIYCEALKSVNIPNSVEIIGMLSFGICDSLETLVIPSSVKHIEIGAAESCPSLNRIVVESGNTHYDSRDNCNAIIETATNTLLSGCNTTVIPQSITHIADYAFDGCQFSSFSIPKGIKYIGDWAFANCSNLKVFTCEAAELPELGTDIFSVIGDIPPLDYATPINEATLFVPQEALEKYKTADQWYKFGTILPIGTYSPDLFPTLTGLQRTTCLKNINENEVGTVWGSNSYLMQEIETTTIDGKQYLLFGTNNTYDEYWSLWLREENNKILVYSAAQKKDLVLYDFTLNVGDSLPRLYVDEELSSIVDYFKYEADWEYTKPLFVTEVSTITLLDGKEYKKWTFDNGMEYVEEIGSFGTSYAWNDFYQLIANGPLYSDVFSQHLVCASRNGQLLYQMDEAEMEQLETECLCEVETSYKDQWCNKWNVMWFDGMRFDETARTSQYRLGKDTIIGDYTYSKFTSRTSVRFTDDRKVYVYYEGFDDNDPYTPDLPTGEYLAYDFSAQVGDTLEVFSGIGTYSTYPCVVDDVQIDSETNLRTMTLHKICRIEDDGFFEEYDDMEMTWIEGVGSPEGFLISYRPCGWVGGGTYALLCAYQGDELKYTGSLYKRFGCDYKAGVVSDDLFPTLSGLQRTICREYCEQADNKTRIEQFTNLTTRTETGGPYLYYSPFLLREKDNKILIYSRTLNKDLVLYDFNLQVGDSLPMLYIDFFAKDDWIADRDMEIWCVVDYHKDLEGNILPADTLIVTDVSAITLLDGKEYKKWTFNNGMEYVEGIGSFGNRQWSGDFFQLIANKAVPTCLLDEHLICASKNGQLLYKMDDAEMERLGAECLCDYNSGPKKDNAKNGKIGGRPTPTQWNMLEFETKEVDGTPTITRAETFSYTLEDDSIVAKGKTFYQLARQSTKDTAITKSFVGALHFGEDEDNRVYFLRDGVEYVLYDFTAEPGDTIEIFAGINNYPQETTYTHVVTGKDTLENGACRMMLEVVFPEEIGSDLEQQHLQKVWLAGLGSIDGIVHNAASRATKARRSDTQTSVMLCAWRDDNCLYTTNHPEYDTFGCVYNQDPTGVEDVETLGIQYQKILRDGHLYILRDNKIYDVLGTPLN